MMNKEEMLYEIQMLDFALQDVMLFLDLNPDNQEAKQFYRVIKKQLALYIREYERKYTTLTNRSVFTYNHIAYVQDLWPWERNVNKEEC